MLSPDSRALYTDALKPPPGYRFEEAIAATYSLDLETLLSLPLHLALFSADHPMEELLKDGVALLEALRRAVGRMTIYAQASRVIVPSQPHSLFTLLEPTVIEVMPPSNTGAFHPKVWVLRFRGPTNEERIRCLVLTRNLTRDDCWDLSLSLDGVPQNAPREQNAALARFLRTLPDLALRAAEDDRTNQSERLAELVERTEWELPEGFEEVRFHTCGVPNGQGWMPEGSRCLAVISPFLGAAALGDLCDSTDEPVALVSRPEELDAMSPDTLGRFGRVMTLMAEAETEDGEESPLGTTPDQPARGLHAKVYVAERGWNTHVVVGSANASNPALVHGTNVEVVAELIGKRSRVGGVDDLLGADGVGSLLEDYLAPAEPTTPDPAIEAAQTALEDARRILARAGLRVRFDQTDGAWHARLEANGPVDLPGVATVEAWLVTRRSETNVDARTLREGGPIDLGEAPLSLLTSFVAFQLEAEAADESIEFVLGLEAVDLPSAERDAAVVRDIIRNRDGFLRYVLLLLAEATGEGGVFGTGGKGAWRRFGATASDLDALPVFEVLTRAYCEEPERLSAIRRLIEDMRVEDGEADVVPGEFMELWAVFEEAMGSAPGSVPGSAVEDGA